MTRLPCAIPTPIPSAKCVAEAAVAGRRGRAVIGVSADGIRLARARRQRERERAAAVHLRLDPDPAAVRLDDSLGDRQSEPGSAAVIRPPLPEPVEHPLDLI